MGKALDWESENPGPLLSKSHERCGPRCLHPKKGKHGTTDRTGEARELQATS